MIRLSFWENLFGRNDNIENYEKSNDIFTLAYGENFPIPRNKLGEGIKVEILPMGMFICLYYSNPTKDEVDRIQTDEITLYFAEMQAVLECVIQVGEDIWGDAPYFAPLYKRKLTENEFRVTAVYVCLVDADTNLLKSMRIIELPAEVKSFISSIQSEQFVSGISNEEYNQIVDCVQQQYSPHAIVSIADCAVAIERDNQIKYMIK